MFNSPVCRHFMENVHLIYFSLLINGNGITSLSGYGMGDLLLYWPLDLRSSPNITRVIKLRRMRRTGTRSTYKGEVHTRFWWVSLRERGHLEELGVDETFLWFFCRRRPAVLWI